MVAVAHDDYRGASGKDVGMRVVIVSEYGGPPIPTPQPGPVVVAKTVDVALREATPDTVSGTSPRGADAKTVIIV